MIEARAPLGQRDPSLIVPPGSPVGWRARGSGARFWKAPRFDVFAIESNPVRPSEPRCRPLSSACAAILSHRPNSPRTTSRLPWDPFKSHRYPLQQRWGCSVLFDRLCCCRRSIGGRAQAAPSCRSRCVLHVPQLNLDSLDSLCGGSHSNISNISYPSLHVSGRMPSSLRRPRSCTLTRTWRR